MGSCTRNIPIICISAIKPIEDQLLIRPDVIYLITPDRFANGDQKNDVVKN